VRWVPVLWAAGIRAAHHGSRLNHSERRSIHVSATTDTQRGLWRVAGALAIAHVVIMLAGLSLQKVATVGASPSAYVTAYENGSLVKVMTGACLTCASFLIFLLAATLLARLVRGQAELSRWWASIAAASGAIYVAITLAVALPGVAAAT
jgi:hypothetical protein